MDDEQMNRLVDVLDHICQRLEKLNTTIETQSFNVIGTLDGINNSIKNIDSSTNTDDITNSIDEVSSKLEDISLTLKIKQL